MTSLTVKTRFAPSPTGFLHVGGLRTALFAYLWARKNKGSFLLRIEDTDKAREVDGSAEQIQSILKEFGLIWDEGPYVQSQRLEIYHKYAEELLEKGGAYIDSTSPPNPSPPSQRRAQRLGRGVAIRQRIPKGETVEFEDIVYGKIKIETDKLDEGVLMKSDGYPTYNFAHIVDDHLMEITHVMRGEEFIPSMPKYILLYRAFGWEPPEFAHLPLILDKNRKKLSKRTGDVAVEEYLKKGYLKEALLNFIALLGWNPKSEKEIFSLEELIAEFAIEKINKAGAVFDIEKLDYINREWQRKLNLGEDDPLYQRTKKLLEEKFHNAPQPPLILRGGVGELLPWVWPLILERVKGPSDLEEKLPEFYFFFEEPRYDAGMLIWKEVSKDRIKDNLIKLNIFLENNPLLISPLHKGEKIGEALEKETKQFLEKENIKTGEALWPLRVALSGLKNSPGPFEIIRVFCNNKGGREVIKKRIDKAIEKL